MYKAYLAARKSKRNKKETAAYEADALACTYKLERLLKTHRYKPSPFKNFTIHEPKERLIQAPAFVDKVVLHAMTDFEIYDAITKDFIRNNHASQENKGSLDGLSRLRQAMNEYYRKNKTSEGWVLKCDIRHFFASIDHDLLKEVLKKTFIKRNVDPQIYELMCLYIDSSEGLPLGYQTSQLMALLFLNEFDHWVKEEKKIKYYGRYMDDFYLISSSKEELQKILKEMKIYFKRIGLELNNKTAIFPLKNGIDFLGFHFYLTDTGKVVMKLRRSAVKKIRKRIKKWKRMYNGKEITKEEIKECFCAWDAFASFGDTYKLRKQLADEVGEMIGEKIIPRRPIRSTNAVRQKRKLKQQEMYNKKHGRTKTIGKTISYSIKENNDQKDQKN